MASLQNNWPKAVLLVFLAVVVTAIEATYVGDLNVYSLQAAGIRLQSHEWILHNHTPPGGWNAVGENAVNIRIGIPYLVEFLHRTTGVGVLRLYKGLDIAFIWLSFIILFMFLRRWFDRGEALVACLYFGAILPLTFAFHSYHPWDRASLAAWLLAFWAARERRFWSFWAITILAVIIKYDAIVLPTLYFFANSTRENWRKILFQSCVVGASLLVIFAMLRILLPGGFEPRNELGLILRNFRLITQNAVVLYAPVLAFGLPLLLAAQGYAIADRFMRAGLWFAGIVTVPLFIATNFEEVRAEQMLFPLIAPAAMLGLRSVLREPLAYGFDRPS